MKYILSSFILLCGMPYAIIVNGQNDNLLKEKEQRITTLNERIATLNKQITDCNNKSIGNLDTIRVANTILQNEVWTYKDSLTSKKKSLQKLKTTLKSIQNAQKSDSINFQNQLKALNTVKDSLLNIEKKLLARKDKLSQKVKTIDKTLQEKQTELDQAQASLDDMISRYTKVNLFVQYKIRKDYFITTPIHKQNNSFKNPKNLLNFKVTVSYAERPRAAETEAIDDLVLHVYNIVKSKKGEERLPMIERKITLVAESEEPKDNRMQLYEGKSDLFNLPFKQFKSSPTYKYEVKLYGKVIGEGFFYVKR